MTSKSKTHNKTVETWCDGCTYSLILECRMCHDKMQEHKDLMRVVMCKCKNNVMLARVKEQEYLVGGTDKDAVFVHMKRTGCVSVTCKPRSETIVMTLFQWEDFRQQFISGDYLHSAE